MKDKLYSRKKIRLPNFSRLREISSFKILLLILLFTIILAITVFIRSAYPVLKTTCETTASSKGNKIVNDKVSEVMKEYTYDSLIKIEKDVNGKISFIETNSTKMNEVVGKIVANIQEEFDKIPRIKVYLNMGSISGISILKNFKPQFEIELESAGNIEATVKTEFESVGINQTLHKIYLDINTKVGILTPFATFGKDVNSDVLLTEAIIVGEVPETYYNLTGLESADETYNFVQ